jgi:hypothetical protein
MSLSRAKRGHQRTLRRGAAYAIPISDGSFVPAVLQATNVLFGGCAIALIDRKLESTEECGEICIRSETDVLAFLLTHPTYLKDGSWPFLTDDVSIDLGLQSRLDPDRISGLVYPVSVVKGYMEACMGLREWDQPLSDRWKPQDLLLSGRRRPPRSRRRLRMVPE